MFSMDGDAVNGLGHIVSSRLPGGIIHVLHPLKRFGPIEWPEFRYARCKYCSLPADVLAADGLDRHVD